MSGAVLVSGFMHDEVGKVYYKAVLEKMTWAEARERCKDFGPRSTLAYFRNIDDWYIFYRFAKSHSSKFHRTLGCRPSDLLLEFQNKTKTRRPTNWRGRVKRDDTHPRTTVVIMLAIARSENVYARPCMYICVRLERDKRHLCNG